MNQPLFNPADAATGKAMLVPAPLSDGKTVPGYSGIMLSETRNPAGEVIVSVGIVAGDGSVVGVLLDDMRFDNFCLQLAPFVERARNRLDGDAVWTGKTVQ